MLVGAAACALLAGAHRAEAHSYGYLSPSASLPSPSACLTHVNAEAPAPASENRPQNAGENANTSGGGFEIDGASDAWETRRGSQTRTAARATGTTHRLIRWAACAWGLDERVTKARAVEESYWDMDEVGDGGLSFGILQVKPSVHKGTAPAVIDSTSANLIYANAWQRACLDGDFTWLGSAYRTAFSAAWKSDATATAKFRWGCVGAWFSGNWRDSGAISYISRVKTHYSNQPWLQSGW